MSHYQRILVAIDLQHEPKTLLDKAVGLAATDADIHVVNVVVPLNEALFSSGMGLITPILDADKLTREIKEAAESSLGELCKNYHRTINFEVIEGQVDKTLQQKMEAYQPDLIIVGSHAKHGIELLLGSIANFMLHHASCDLLAVRPVS